MRTVSYKEILWAIAHEEGIDPDITRNGQGIMPDQADAWTSYVNAWVRRLYDQEDYPEWTQTTEFIVPTNHIVPWSVHASAFTGPLVDFGRVLKVYLVDPSTTYSPVDTPFRLSPAGIHVGFEHGSSVWIKYVLPCPQFSAMGWDANLTYKKDQVIYSISSGECYKSKVNGNHGHDPEVTFSPPPTSFPIEQPQNQLSTELVNQLTRANPGILAQNQITRIKLQIIAGNDTVPAISDPPPNLSQFYINAVEPSIPGTQIGAAITLADGAMTLLDVLTDLTNQLITALSGGGYTVTKNDADLTIDLERGAQFESAARFTPQFGPDFYLLVQQIQPYIAAISATDGERQVINFTLTDDNVIHGGIYTLTFKDVAGVDHVIEYESGITDTANQILVELVNQIGTLSQTDPFFMDIAANIDAAAFTAAFSSASAISLDASLTLPGSPWWEVVRLPFIMFDQVVRGAVADDLRATGQSDRSGAEEQAIPQEVALTSGKILAPQYLPLTDQSRRKEG